MKIIPVKGTRDFYPEPMRLRNWIVDTWRRVSLRNGFEEYDSPIFEYLDLFTIKSGDEIASQLFNFTDRGGRSLAIRPEITPALARMVNAKINALPRPIKWFSVPRLCRAENPQRGRLREFFQWNVDVIGSDSVLADAECIFTAADFLREVGLTPDDVKIRIGSRPLVMAKLRELGVGDTDMEQALLALDKRPKISNEAFGELCGQFGFDASRIGALEAFLDVDGAQAVQQAASMPGLEAEAASLEKLFESLAVMGVGDYVVFDWHIVRGLAYYTGVVYEVIADGERAVAGGGRYDNLLQILGGPQVGATGFGMGDVVLGILLDEKGKIPADVLARRVDLFVIDSAEGMLAEVLKLVGTLRGRGLSAEYSYKRQNVGKQLKAANRCGARRAVIVRPDGVSVKDMAGGDQQDMPLEAFLRDPLAGS